MTILSKNLVRAWPLCPWLHEWTIDGQKISAKIVNAPDLKE